MTVEIPIVISVISVGFAICSGMFAMKRNKTADDKKEATEMTTVIVKLESIGKDTSEIKSDMRSVKAEVKNNTEKIIRLDESLKSAWRRINRLEGKGDLDD